MLRRFADARLRAVLRRALTARNDARADVRILRRRVAARDHEIGTLRVLVATWQRIARQAQDDLTAARETGREAAYLDVMEGRAIVVRAEVERQVREQLTAERARQETHQ